MELLTQVTSFIHARECIYDWWLARILKWYLLKLAAEHISEHGISNNDFSILWMFHKLLICMLLTVGRTYDIHHSAMLNIVYFSHFE